MTQEALKLALEALKWCHGGEPCGTAEAITAIEEALAQPEQEPDYWLGYGLQAHTEKPFEGATPLYTTPPQRTWVGLTDDEQRDIAYSDINVWDWGELMDAVEAKLKEKNT